MWKGRLLILAAALIAYLPALNNGFIADDWVILHRVDVLKTDLLYLNESVPENFRFTSYLVFGVLKEFFGYSAAPYYIFNILLHAVNCLLLAVIVREVTGNNSTALLSGLFLALFQAPQEAVMWLAAMNETLSAFFIFVAALLWFRRLQGLAALAFVGALSSKESALVFILLLPLVDWIRGKQSPWRDYVILAIPAATFFSLILLTLSSNFQVGSGTYVISARAIPVLLKSLHRLIWPWGYLVFAILMFGKAKPGWKSAAWMALIPVTMLPYVFVSYTGNIPSRQTYLGSAVFVSLLAAGMLWIQSRGLRVGLISAFVLVNVAYMWIVKDRQMEARALPTTALVETLRQYSPQDVRIRQFEYPVDLIPKAVAVSLKGWRWDQVDLEDTCRRCLLLEWNRETGTYSAREVQ